MTSAAGLRMAVRGLPAVTAVLVVAVYAGLLPGGRWQGDDYLGAAFVAQGNWPVMLAGLRWGPRPLAASLTWLYFAAAVAVGRPLIATFLAALWLLCAAGVAWAGWTARAQRPVLMALALFALTLLLTRPGEMFYWPVGAAAYVPCWAGLAAATMIHRGTVARHGLALMLALFVAALSAEIGAITVLLYAGLALAVGLYRRDVRSLRWVAPAAAVAAAVCLQVLRGRMALMGEVMDPASGLAGHWPASIAAAVPDFARELAGISGLPLAAGAALKLALVLCLMNGRASAPAAWRRALPWGMALLASAFASIALAYHQFGALCCERHATFRQGMIVLAISSLAGLLRGPPALARQAGLAAVLGALLAVRSAPLRTDYRGLGAVIAARQRTWQSARGPGDAMSLYLSPPARITNADSLPAGTFTRRSDVMWGDGAWYAWGIMATFGKHHLTIVPDKK